MSSKEYRHEDSALARFSLPDHFGNEQRPSELPEVPLQASFVL